MAIVSLLGLMPRDNERIGRSFPKSDASSIQIGFGIGHDFGGGNPAAVSRRKHMSLASLCLILGVMIGFATLILKVVELSRRKD
ncbi:MAG: hypothetical protein V4459_10195 [Pseudomonadota bacterium]